MKNGKRVVLEVVCFLFLLCAGSLCASAAELPDLSLKHCMTVYPWKTGRVTVYETDTLSKKKEVIPYDMCKAVKVSENAVQISYKVDGTTKGWVRKEVFFWQIRTMKQKCLCGQRLLYAWHTKQQ